VKGKIEHIQRCIEDHLLLLLEEAGGFFLIVSIITRGQDCCFWTSATISFVLWLISIVRFVGLLTRRITSCQDGFPRFILVWQTLFLIAYRIAEGSSQVKTFFLAVMLLFTLAVFAVELRSAVK